MISNSLVAHFLWWRNFQALKVNLGLLHLVMVLSCDGFEGELRFTSGFEGELEFFEGRLSAIIFRNLAIWWPTWHKSSD